MLTLLSIAVVVAGAPPADLLVINARIFGEGLAAPAGSLAVRDGRFVAVGEAAQGETTEVVDAGGRVVLPGLIDAHIHMLSGGTQLHRLELRDAASPEDFVARVEGWAATLGADRWILGRGWSTESWDATALPTRHWVDPVSGGRPLLLRRMDGHSALANSRALELAGIDADGPPDPPGGVIDRDAETGEPTGILRETAMGLVDRHVPPMSIDDQVAALRAAAQVALDHGITAVGDIAGIEDLPAYRALAAEQPAIRFYVYLTAGDWAAAARRARTFDGRTGWVELRGFKTYIDGSLGSQTAYMREPYLVAPEGGTPARGLLREGIAEGDLERNLAAAMRAGMQPIAHAIGDEANHVLLEALFEVYGDPVAIAAARPRSEHAQHLLPEDIEIFAAMGVIASMQPYHKADDGRYAESYIGSERSRSSYAFKSLLDAGAAVAFGSDWPVVTLDPMLGIEAAVTGRTLDGRHWQIQENITVGEAIRCYTARAAYALFAEGEIGRIAPGYRADFVILEGSPFGAGPDRAAIRPHAVYVEGRRER